MTKRVVCLLVAIICLLPSCSRAPSKIEPQPAEFSSKDTQPATTTFDTIVTKDPGPTASAKTSREPIALFQQIAKDKAFELHQMWRSLEDAGQRSGNVTVLSATPLWNVGLIRAQVIELLGKPESTSMHKVPGLLGAVEGKSVELSASFLWYGSIGLGSLAEKDDSNVVAVGYKPSQKK